MDVVKALGCEGEALVARFLERQGFCILEKNYKALSGGRCIGEVDIIAKKDDMLVFVEVKTRKVAYFPIETHVTPGKQRRIIKAAKLFMIKRGVYDMACRLDVATVLYSDDGHHTVDYIENAFEAY